MRRLLGIVTHNWPLKVAAVVLATLLYAGFVVSQSVREFTGTIPITALNMPTDVRLQTNLPAVTSVRYLSISDPGAIASTDSFQASVDLANVDPDSGPTTVPVRVVSVDPRFQVVSAEPPVVQVTLDPVKTRSGIPVRVVTNPTPEGLDVRPAVIDPETVSVRGPASVVDRVVRVEANVQIEPNGLDVDRDVELIPVDEVGDRLTPIDVNPPTAHVFIAVFSDLESRPLAVTPVLGGTQAAGYEVTGIAVDPLVVTVEGDADAILGLTEAPTESVSINGVTQDVVQDVGLDLPDGVQPAGGVDLLVRVTVTITPLAGTRSFDAGIVPSGTQAGLEYRLATNHAIALVGGPIADLDRLDAAEFQLLAPVGGLGPGVHEVTLTANLQVGLTLVSVEPPTVSVTITLAANPAPSPSP
ncbi:MAG TPA: CdaR family protein [Candidatus Limnocylindrales bacterium]|nr:CdaR family protein [Candidatus Limnocylindrales bacterium]